MPRSNSPRATNRRYVLRVLAACKYKFGVLHSTWSVSGKIFDLDNRDGLGNVPQRDRRADEFPENNPQAWLDLIAQIDDVTDGLDIARKYARKRLNELYQDGVR